MNRLSKKWLSSDRLFTQILGALINKWWWIVTIIWIVLLIFLLCSYIKNNYISPQLQILALTTTSILAFSVCNTLTNIYNLRKKEHGITWCQISILITIGVWIIGVLAILNVRMTEKNTVVFGVIGGLLAWIFQDKVKGALAFIHLRFHHLLSIDDWIQVPKHNVDGIVKRVSLTTVTVYNWDTTTSTIPISALHSDHFINLQNMASGKTYGRLMNKSFIFDTTEFHALTASEIERLKQRDEVMRYLTEDDINQGVLNAHLFRLFLFHWLMNNPHVSQLPRLMVRWLEHNGTGMPLQVWAHIIESELVAFEWQQSQIIEHIVESLEWFGLKLYQRPSSQDISNGINSLAGKEASNRKEDEQ